jgi:hypothetical protein
LGYMSLEDLRNDMRRTLRRALYVLPWLQ